MSKENDIKRMIADCEKEIEVLEKKRNRSEAALLEAIINHEKPNETDTEYFKKFSRLIELERANIRKLNEELAALA